MAAEIAGGVGTVALFAAPGYALTELFAGLRARPAAARAAYGYLLGVAWVGGALFALSHLFAVPLRAPAVWSVAAAPLLAGLAAAARRRRHARTAVERRPRAPGHPADPPAQAGPPLAAPRPAQPLHDPAPKVPLAPATAAVPAPPAGGKPAERRRRPGWRWVTAACAIAAAVLCLAIFAEAVSDPVNDWDGRMTWATQARYVRQAGTVDAPVLRQAPWYVTHPQYPLLLPLAQVAALEAFHADPDGHAVRALYAAFLPALLLIVWDGARRTAGGAAAAAAALALAVAPFMLLGAGGAATTYSDLPLACFYGAAVALALAPRPGIGDALAMGLMLAALALTKNEGAALALVPLVVGWRAASTAARAGGSGDARSADRGVLDGGATEDLPARATALDAGKQLTGAREPGRTTTAGATLPGGPAAGNRPASRLPRAAAAAAPLVAALALLDAWRLGIVNRQDESYPELFAAGHGWSHLWLNLRQVAPVLLGHMINQATWGGFWLLAAALLALGGRRTLRHPRQRRLLLAAAAPAAIGLAAYAVHPVPVFAAQITWDRLLLQGTAPLAMALAAATACTVRAGRGGRGGRGMTAR